MKGTSITHVATTPSLVQKHSRILFPGRSHLFGGYRNVSGRTSSFSLSAIRQEDTDDTSNVFDLRVYCRKDWGVFHGDISFPIVPGDVIAGKYEVVMAIKEAWQMRVFKALDLEDNTEVCVKAMSTDMTRFPSGLNEINVLKCINGMDSDDEQGIVRLLDFFYYRSHLFSVFELLEQNLYELQSQSLKICQDVASEEYFFNLRRIQRIARQLVKTLSYLHSHDIIHADLKPENILMKDLASCTIKVIDFDVTCSAGGYLSPVVQTKPYEAPEVSLGLKYDQRVDIWSLGCIMVELFTGQVLFETSDFEETLFRIVNVRGAVPHWMILEGENSHLYFTPSGEMLRRSSSRNHSHTSESSQVKCTLWGQRGPPSDEAFQDFVSQLLTIDPRERPTAQEISQHPWLRQNYEE